MPRTAVLDREGEARDEIELNPEIFEIEVNEDLIYEAVTAQLKARRTGTAKTKTRSEVAGGGRKPWRQKGTGRARHGSIRSPLWVGGGIIFGPQPKNYRNRMPKKARKKAVRSALSAKYGAGELKIIDELEFSRPRTRDMVDLIRGLGLEEEKVLFVTAEREVNTEKSGRNIPGVSVLPVDGLTVYHILAHDQLVFVRGALSRLEEVLA